MNKEFLNTIRIIIALVIGFSAGHFQGKVQVYEQMLQRNIDILKGLE